MAVFVLVFFLLYGGMNFYLVRKVYLAFPGVTWLTVLASVFCLFMILAPILIRNLERQEHIALARTYAWIGYTWFALIFWFLSAGVVLELWNAAVRFLAHRPQLALAPKPFLAIVAALVAIAALCATLEANRIRIKEIHLKTSKLSADTGPVRIVDISDVHLSLMLGEKTLSKVVALINAAKPDLLVSTGDLVDGTFVEPNHLGELFESVQPMWGKFACLGNHDQFAGLPNSIAFHDSAGFRVLRGEAASAGPVVIAGVDDPAIIPSAEARSEQETAALNAAVKLGPGPVILLKHRPTIDKHSQGHFDLQLSGHTHGGQIFPFSLVAYAFNGVRPGLHALKEGGWLYLSRGTGTWGPRMRLFSPPEVTLIVLEPAR